MDLGCLARDRRLALGLTQAALAARVGVSRKWIVDLEAGKRAADLSLVLRALNVLGFQLDLTLDDPARPSEIDEVVDASRRSRR
jgi:HTH-type transcriptional regulator/antitoxin HipB